LVARPIRVRFTKAEARAPKQLLGLRVDCGGVLLFTIKARSVLLVAIVCALAGLVHAAAVAHAATTVRISVKDTIAGENAGGVDMAVRLSGPSATTVTVQYSTNDGTAGHSAPNNDYTCLVNCGTGTLSFAPGETVKTLHIPIINDGQPEGFESFTFDLSNPSSNATIARSPARISIVDNDHSVATPRLFVRDVTVDEKDGTAFVPVMLGGPGGERSSSTVSVHYTTANGTATAPGDYVTKSNTLTFSPGSTVRNIPVTINDDASPEPAERFRVTLDTPTHATIANGTGTILIGASDGGQVATPRVSVPDVIVGEGDGYVDVPLTLSAPSTNLVTVQYSTSDATANSTTDYLCPVAKCFANTLKFAPGETTKYVRIEIRNDTAGEPFESFTVDLGTNSGSNATLGRTPGRVSIVDNDHSVATPGLFVRDVIVDEKDGAAIVPVLLGGPTGESSTKPVSVPYTTINNTATAPGDYTTTSGTLTFAAGQTVKNIPIVVNDDGAEGPERFLVVLGSPLNASIANGVGTVLIGASSASEVATPRVSVPDVIVGEGDGYVDVPVTLSAPSTNLVTVQYSTSDATAKNTTDYLCPVAKCFANKLWFAPGETTKYVRIEIRNDGSGEPFKSFTVDLATSFGGSNATVGRSPGRISIVDNDHPATTPNLFVRDVTVDEKDGVAIVPVLLGGPHGAVSTVPVTVDYTTMNGSATTPGDYATTNGTLTFAAGQTVKNIPVVINDDGAQEATQQFTLALSNAKNATIADGSGAIVIGANEAGNVASPGISVADRTVPEGVGYLDVPVTFSAPSASLVTVQYTTANGSPGATSGSDFVCPVRGCSAGHLFFGPGQTTQYVRIEITDDTTVESTEPFTLNIAASGGTVVKPHGTIQITDND
jgi:hypothetical protein